MVADLGTTLSQPRLLQIRVHTLLSFGDESMTRENQTRLAVINFGTIAAGIIIVSFAYSDLNGSGSGLIGAACWTPIAVTFHLTNPVTAIAVGIALMALGGYTAAVTQNFARWDENTATHNKIIASVSLILGFLLGFLFLILISIFIGASRDQRH
jgi:hypothetical protein